MSTGIPTTASRAEARHRNTGWPYLSRRTGVGKDGRIHALSSLGLALCAVELAPVGTFGLGACPGCDARDRGLALSDATEIRDLSADELGRVARVAAMLGGLRSRLAGGIVRALARDLGISWASTLMHLRRAAPAASWTMPAKPHPWPVRRQPKHRRGPDEDQQAQSAALMREEGWTWDDIGRALRINPITARRLVRALGRDRG